MSAEILARLDQLLNGQHRLSVEFAALRESIETAREPARSLKFKDRAAAAAILPVVAAYFSGTFAAWELIDCAAQRDALGANLRIVLGKRTAQELGQLFQRAAGCDFDGIRIVREGRDGNGARWRCSVTGASLPAR